jgi:FtsZ-binding cell division protein ZapB
VQEKDQLFAEKSYLNTEVQAYREKNSIVSRTVASMNEQSRNLEQQVNSLKGKNLISQDFPSLNLYFGKQLYR